MCIVSSINELVSSELFSKVPDYSFIYWCSVGFSLFMERTGLVYFIPSLCFLYNDSRFAYIHHCVWEPYVSGLELSLYVYTMCIHISIDLSPYSFCKSVCFVRCRLCILLYMLLHTICMYVCVCV